MRLALLAVRMLRYRVAAMLWLFMLLGAAVDGLESVSWRHVLAAAVLGAAYVAATTVNDVADRELDRVNHPRDPGRPLVSGDADERDLWRLHVVACVLALLLAAPLGGRSLALAGASLAIGWAYSLPPARLAYRTHVAGLALGVAYVLVPYGLGVVVRGSPLAARDGLLAGALYALFVARITLKDFRDRAGDAAFGKPTFLLRYGKRTTCVASLVALVAGDALLLAFVRPSVPLGLVLEGFVVAIGSRLLALDRARDERSEQIAIGIGARMGNGLLLTVLGVLVVSHDGSAPERQLGLAIVLAAAFGAGFLALVRRPESAIVGYKG